jgi:hypothetical protein
MSLRIAPRPVPGIGSVPPAHEWRGIAAGWERLYERLAEPLPHQKERRHRFRLGRAVAELARDKPLNGLEAETSAELARRMGDPPAAARGPGMWVPLDAPVLERRALTTTTGTGAVVAPDLLRVIDVLRSRLICARLGAETLADLHGTPFLPRRSSAGSVQWFGESIPAPTSNQTITTQAKFQPHTAGLTTQVSRFAVDLMIPDVEASFIEDAAAGLAVAIDGAALNGSGGGSNQPLGLLQTAGIPVASFGTNGSAPTQALLASMLEVLGNNNGVDGVSLGFATSANGEAACRTAARNGSGSKMLLDGENFTLGCPFASTTNIPNNLTKGTGTGLSAAILGSWRGLGIGLWPLFLNVNPFTQTTAGVVTMTYFMDVDVQIRQASQFVIALDMVAP